MTVNNRPEPGVCSRPVSRRRFLQAAGVGAAAIAGMGCPPANPQAQPNILLLIVDQMRYPQWFPALALLPAYSRLRREGLTFRNHFTCALPCSPSRACLFTGLHQPQHGVEFNVGALFDHDLDPSIPTMGHVFQRAGYRTPYFGKWHLSRSESYNEDGLTPYGFEAWEGPDATGVPGQNDRDADHVSDSIQWLRKHGQDGPWFLTCSLLDPHPITFYPRFTDADFLVSNVTHSLPDNLYDSLEGKPAIQKQYRDLWRQLMAVFDMDDPDFWTDALDHYYHDMRRADDELVRLLTAIDVLGLWWETLVVFTSDHGETAGSHQLMGKAPFVYHEAIKVPMVMRWPGHIPSGEDTDALSQSVDLFPTLCDLANVACDDIQLSGRSLRRVVHEPDRVIANDHVVTSFTLPNPQGLTELPDILDIPDELAPSNIRAIFDGQYKYARYFDPALSYEEYELYDLETDPGEMTNLAGNPDYGAIEAYMAARLAEAEATEMT